MRHDFVVYLWYLIPTLLSLEALEVVIMTTCGAISYGKIGIMSMLGFQYGYCWEHVN